MNRDFSKYKVAIVTESLWKMAGANRVLESFVEIFPNADVFALFGKKESLSDRLRRHSIYFSFLNKLPFIKHIYRYTFSLWPIAVEGFDFSNYDLVISNTSSVVHGAITPLNCKHIAYVNSPMRYAWDLKNLYFDINDYGFLKKTIANFLIFFNRIWDVTASQRPQILIANSNFVKKRIEKYWDRKVNAVIYPPVNIYRGTTIVKRKDYYLSGAPYEPNKRGDFLLECASKLGFNLKIIGNGSMRKRLKKKYKKYKNIEFLDWVSEKEKWDLISNAKGYIVPGIEDYGIFCAEAISAGTPVLAYKAGGSLEIVKENISGMFFNSWNIEEFERVLDTFEKRKWDYEMVRKSLDNVNTKEMFVKKIMGVLVE